MVLAAESGWVGLGMDHVAARADVPLGEALALFANKNQLINGFSRRIDALVLTGADATPNGDETPRDRLFEVLMRRFDALAPYKPALRHIAKSLPRDLACDPLAALCQLGRLAGAMALMLECAGIDSSGAAGRLRTKGLALVYGTALKAWTDDDSPDQAATMAALDRALARAERLAGLFWPDRSER
jgi:AcrR family transcriptional regulator